MGESLCCKRRELLATSRVDPLLHTPALYRERPAFCAAGAAAAVAGWQLAELTLCLPARPLRPAPAPQVYQTLVQQLGPDHPGYIDAVVALAELHRELGQQEAADRRGTPPASPSSRALHTF